MHTHYPQMLSSCWISGSFKRASWPKLRGGGTHVRSLSGTEGNGKVSLCLRSITNHTKTNCQGLTSLKKSLVHTSFFCLWPPPSTQFPNPRAATCWFPSLLLQFSLVSLTQQPADENCRNRGHIITRPAAALGAVKFNYDYIPTYNINHFPSLKQDGLAYFFFWVWFASLRQWGLVTSIAYLKQQQWQQQKNPDIVKIWIVFFA